jgi:hypothetical protein
MGKDFNFSDVSDYFSSLSQLELIGWGLIGVGLLLVILGLIFM